LTTVVVQVVNMLRMREEPLALRPLDVFAVPGGGSGVIDALG
jgi:hypothetical protein